MLVLALTLLGCWVTELRLDVATPAVYAQLRFLTFFLIVHLNVNYFLCLCGAFDHFKFLIYYFLERKIFQDIK